MNNVISGISDQPIKMISIVITTRNRLHSLERICLPALEKLDFQDIPYEIIIVDNASSDGTWEFLKNYGQKSNIKILQEPQKSISSGRNRGVATSQGDLVVFLDDDCEPDPSWLQRIYRLASGKLYVQGQILDVMENRVVLKMENNDFLGGDLAGGNMAIRKEIFKFISFNENIDFFHDDSFFIWQMEAFWPGFAYAFDTKPVSHHKSPSPYRDESRSYFPKFVRKSTKMHDLAYISHWTTKRNINIDKKLYFWRFCLREFLFFFYEIIIMRGDAFRLLMTKKMLYCQLKAFRELL